MESGLRILSAHRGQDTGGQGFRLSQAFRELAPGWEFRSACNSMAVLPYLEYPQDLPWDWELVRDLFQKSDVFHARNDWSTYKLLAEYGTRPSVIHYHGTNFRHLWPQRLREQKERSAIGLVSTLDLFLIKPEALEWLPSPYDLEWLDGYRLHPSSGS